MRVLVTGGTGYLGSAIVRALHARGHAPVVFARSASRAALPGTAVDGDIRHREALLDASADVDGLIHAAALVSIWRRRPSEFDEVNVEGLRNVLDVCAARSVPRIVYTSSFLALPPRGAAEPLTANDYQRTKVRALEIARSAAAHGAPLAILFPGVVYGPGVRTEGNLVGRLVADHLRGRLPGVIGARRLWSYAYVDDVAEAHVTALERDARGEFPLGGVNAPQMRVFEIVRDLTGRRLPLRVPFALAAAAARLDEARSRWLGVAPLVTRGAVDIFRCDWSMDSGRSVSELSYRILGLEEGIARTVASIS